MGTKVGRLCVLWLDLFVRGPVAGRGRAWLSGRSGCQWTNWAVELFGVGAKLQMSGGRVGHGRKEEKEQEREEGGIRR